jgi:hypothetical protein
LIKFNQVLKHVTVTSVATPDTASTTWLLPVSDIAIIGSTAVLYGLIVLCTFKKYFLKIGRHQMDVLKIF